MVRLRRDALKIVKGLVVQAAPIRRTLFRLECGVLYLYLLFFKAERMGIRPRTLLGRRCDGSWSEEIKLRDHFSPAIR